MKNKLKYVLVLLLLTSGCKAGKMPSFSDFGKELLKTPEKKKETKKEPSLLEKLSSAGKSSGKKAKPSSRTPDKIISIWKQSVLTSPKGAIRGFSGRVYFHGFDDKPLSVDGELTVYAFNDKGKAPFKETKAIKKFIFRKQDLPKHHSVSEMGDSYSVWLPFDQVGGPELHLALMPIFRDAKTGKVVQGKQSICTLRGTKEKNGVQTQAKNYQFNPLSKGQVAPVSYQIDANTSKGTNRRSTATKTLTIPRSASAIHDASQHQSGNVSRLSNEELILRARAQLLEKRKHGLDQQPALGNKESNPTPETGLENASKKVSLKEQGTTSRWDSAVSQFRGSRRPNQLKQQY